MAVLAHPDDESTTAGGTLALCAARGVRTVLVMCTNGEYGDRPYGVKPNPDDKNRATANVRIAELRSACAHLLISDLELLGYHDSGTFDADERSASVFRNIPTEIVAANLGALFEKYQPHVVLTHEPASTRHPDHLHASRATALAVETTGIPAKLYYTAHGTEYWERVRHSLVRSGIDRPQPTLQRLSVTDRIDQQITTSVNVVSVVDRKRLALYAHVSQIHNSTAAKVPEAEWPQVFGIEDHIRAYDVTEAALPECDLFDGILES